MSRTELPKICSIVQYWRRQWHPTPVLLPGKSHGWRSLVGCSPWGRWESDTTEQLHFHFSLSCIGEGNGNPLQCFPWRIPETGGAWWAAVYVVTQSRTRLKRLSSSMILCYWLVMWFIIALIFYIFWRQVRPCVVRGWSLPVMRNFAFYPNVIENCISYLLYDIKTVEILE